jgi:hypothetical protein
MAWDRCYDFLNIFAKKTVKHLAFLSQNKAKVCKNLIITLVIEKTPIFCRKLLKIAENCDHNIDPCFVIEKKLTHFIVSYLLCFIINFQHHM